MIYLDNASTTRMNHEVLDAMMPYMSYDYGNPGSLHKMGQSAESAIQKAREQAAVLIDCEPDQIVFTSGGSEGNNLVFAGLIPELKRIGKNGILISSIEHDSIWKAAHSLSTRYGMPLSIVDPEKGGSILPSEIDYRMQDNVGLVSVMKVNNETGVQNPTAEICDIAHRYGAFFHTDAVQAAGSVQLYTILDDYDFLTISSHKIHGPKGVGALYVKDKSVLTPLIYGGDDQEYGLRGGTENVAGIVGFGKACEIAVRNMDKNKAVIKRLNENFRSALHNELGDNVILNGDPKKMSNKVCNIRFPNIDSQSLLLLLDTQGLFVSAGSACRAHEDTPSRVLTAMGLEDEEARSSIRVSFSEDNTTEEVISAAEIIAKSVRTLSGKTI